MVIIVRDDLIYLQITKIIPDEDGFDIETAIEKECFGEIASVKRTEFYTAMSNKINLSAEITISLDDWLDSIIKNKVPTKLRAVDSYTNTSTTYEIIRTYAHGLDMIITCKRVGD